MLAELEQWLVLLGIVMTGCLCLLCYYAGYVKGHRDAISKER